KELKDHRAREVDATVSDAELVAAYEEFLNTHRDHLDFAKVEQVAGTIKELKTSAAAFDKLRQDDKSDSLTVHERLALWQEFQPKRPVSVEAEFKARRVAELERELAP
ncbi:MAG: hypothetical protein ACE5NW_05930, partial [Acidiferrobacterales bacterium]